MTFTYNATTAVGRVRLLISDVKEDAYIFEDDELEAFLALANSSVQVAAAHALETIAANDAMVIRRITILDLQVDAKAEADALIAVAKQLRKNEGFVETASTRPPISVGNWRRRA